MQFEIRRISNGSKHHLFGFHDLVQTNARGDFALALEGDDISHPPLPGDVCDSGVVELETGKFRKVHTTHTWNYPQGARQQWVGDSDLFTCNDRGENGRVFAWLADAREGKTVERLPFPVHCLDAKTNKAFFFDYDRVHSCGGYGYCTGKKKSLTKLENIPRDNGIFRGDLKSGNMDLLASIEEVASCGEKRPVKTGFPHYVTHFMLNPSGTRIAFLHRYRIPDGGETTRLMSIGTDGSGLRCLAKGFLSHFTWISETELFIWGAHQPGLFAMRELSALRVPGVLQAMLFAKAVMRWRRSIRNNKQIDNAKDKATEPETAFLTIKDCDNPERKKSAVGILTEDGHPMARPGNLLQLISDTYPDKEGDRTLIFHDLAHNTRVDLGKFRMIPDRPDVATFDIAASQSGMDKRVMRKFNRADYLFYRSGFHCDLHPRWSHDGKSAFFDSIHEGTRQIYQVRFLEDE